jgi:hypothetical protein
MHRVLVVPWSIAATYELLPSGGIGLHLHSNRLGADWHRYWLRFAGQNGSHQEVV